MKRPTMHEQPERKKLRRRTTQFSLLFCFCLILTSPSFAQTATVSVQKTTLKSLLEQIEKQSGCHFTYMDSELPSKADVSVNAQNQSVEKILGQVLTARGLTYTRTGKNFAIKRKNEQAVPEMQVANATPVTVRGTVKDENGEPVIGATITPANGKGVGTVTDLNGQFSIDVPENALLKVSFIGYLTQEVKALSKKNLDIILKDNAKVIDEVVVIGYTPTTKSKLTTSITSLKMDNIDKGASLNAMQSIQGKAAGVQISNLSGIPGSNPVVVVRGVNSFSGSVSPLYVVDGIITDGFPSLNQNDIESIDILKDASSSAIYGSRGNNGVVIITTKQGKQGKSRIDISSRIGYSGISRDIKMANSAEYTDVMKAAVNNYNTQTGQSIVFDIPETIEETDWVSLITNKSSQNIENNVSISGGDTKTSFYLSLGNNIQEGYIKTSKANQYNFRTNLSHRLNSVVKVNFNIGINKKYTRKVEQESSSLKVLRTAREEQPWYGAYDADGNYTVNGGNTIVRHNPVMLVNEEKWTVDGLTGLGNLGFEITPVKGLKYSPSINFQGYLSDEIKKITEKHDARKGSWPAITQNRNESYRYTITNLLSYNGTVSGINYTALAGHEFFQRVVDNFGAKSDIYGAFPSSNFNLINAGANIYADGISYGAYNVESYFGRLTLDYGEKYFLNASIRRDASSKLTKTNRNGYFPALSLGWKISNEGFFPKQRIITGLKLRTSWGTTGSIDPIDYFDPLSLVSAGKSYNGQAGYSLSSDARPLKWEISKQVNLGFDLDLFGGRISMEGDYYVKKSDNLLYRRPIQVTSGFTSIISNIGAVKNTGFDFLVNTKVLTGDLKLDVGGNISFVNNKMVSLYPGAPDIYTISGTDSNLYGGSLHAFIVNKPVSTYYLYNMLGIYQRDEDVPAKLYAKGVRAGDVMYEDINDDGDISADDRKNVGKAIPDFFGGINSTLSWKGISLSINGRFSVGGKVFASWMGANGVEGTDNPAMSPSNRGTGEQYFNVREYYAKNYWRGEGTSNTVPRPIRVKAHTGYSYGFNSLSSTRYLFDATFFRIQTATLAYNLPQKWINVAGLNAVKVYVTADNLLTFSKYRGYDPESSFADGPAGAYYGVDFGLEPVLRTFSFGINIKL